MSDQTDNRFYRAPAAPAPEPVAWPAKCVSLKQKKDRKLLLTLELDAVEPWPNY
jgi:hypothetical protein